MVASPALYHAILLSLAWLKTLCIVAGNSPDVKAKTYVNRDKPDGSDGKKEVRFDEENQPRSQPQT